MNSLTWALYGVDVVSNVAILGVVAFELSLIGCVIALIAAAIRADCSDKSFAEYLYDHWKVIKKYVIGGCIFYGLTTFVPGKTTMYLMLSSELTGKMAASQEFKTLYSKSFELLNQKIDEALEDRSKKKK